MKDNRDDGIAEGWFGCWVLLDGLAHVGRDNWCSRGPRRSLVAAIFRSSANRTGKIGGPERTCVGLHRLHARPVRISLGYFEGYTSGSRDSPRAPVGPSQMASQTAFGFFHLFLTQIMFSFTIIILSRFYKKV